MREVLEAQFQSEHVALVSSFPHENTYQTMILFMDIQCYLWLVNGLSETKRTKEGWNIVQANNA
jgi:hypothetical protein